MLSIRSLVLALAVSTLTIGVLAEEPVQVAIAAHSHLNDATALINKNTVSHSQNVAIVRSNIRGQQDDVMATDNQEQQSTNAEDVDDGDQPRDVPSGLVLTGDRDSLKAGEVEEAVPDKDEGVTDAVDHHEQRGFVGYRRRFFYPGFRGGYYGWRYPLPYWRRYGRRFYGGVCPFGRIYGGYFYC